MAEFSLFHWLFVLGLLVFGYFAPSWVARKKSTFSSIFVVNLFLGWTFVGWVVALAWALKNDPKPMPVSAP
jgi:hypothetical protein